jgi:hypothetical protein
MSNPISLVPVNVADADDDLGFFADSNKSDVVVNQEPASAADLEIKNIESMNNISIPNISQEPSLIPSGVNEAKPIKLDTAFQIDSAPLNLGSSNENISLNNITIPNISSSNTSNSIPLIPTSNETKAAEEPKKSSFSFFGSSTTTSKEEPQKTAKDIMREKMFYLNKFESLREKGVRVMKHFDSTSNLEDMKMEYERLKSQRDAANSIKFQRRMMMMFVTGVEYMNNKFDPFDIDLDGWGESVHENLEDYDDIFEDLYEKYKDRAKMAPELRLMFALGGSAFMFNITNKMFKSSMPGMSDIRRQNPGLAEQMQGNQSGGGGNRGGGMPSGFPGMPGLSNFMGLFSGGGGGGGENKSENNSVAEEMKNFAGTRPEMKGPSDMDEILANIEKQQSSIRQRQGENMSVISENPSVTKRNLNISLG